MDAPRKPVPRVKRPVRPSKSKRQDDILSAATAEERAYLSSANGNKTLIYIVVGVVVLLLIVAGIYFFNLHRLKKAGYDDYATYEEVSTTEMVEFGDNPAVFELHRADNVGNRNVTFVWPVSGATGASWAMQKWVAQSLDMPDAKSAQDIIDYYSGEPDALPEGARITVTAKPVGDDFVLLCSEYLAWRHIVSYAYFRLSNGAKLTNASLPKAKDFLPTLNRALYSEVPERGDSFRPLWDYEFQTLLNDFDVYFDEKGLHYTHLSPGIDDVTGIEYLSLTVPYDALIGVIGETTLDFIPKKYVDEFFKDETELTQGTVKSLLKYIDTNGPFSSFPLSKKFARNFELGKAMPGSPDGSIGDEEFVYYWYGGQESDVRGLNSTSVSISQIDRNHATAYVRPSNSSEVMLTLKLVREKVTAPSGKSFYKWVIDDCNGINDRLEGMLPELYQYYSTHSVDSIMSDPEYTRLSDDWKREYRERVEKFLTLYKAGK